MKAVNDGENRQTLIYGMGDQHIDIIVSKLLSKYKVEVELAQPKVAFRETLRKKSDVDSKYKKQSGGHGQYGHVKMTFEPSGDLEQPYVFEQIVVGGAVPKNYFPAVEKGIQESVVKGPLAGYPVVGVKAVLYDGSYHPVDSSEMAFKTAASQAFKKGFMDASPVLLEPIASVKVTVPDKFTGDVMGDLNKRRGRVLGMNPDHMGTAEVTPSQIVQTCTWEGVCAIPQGVRDRKAANRAFWSTWYLGTCDGDSYTAEDFAKMPPVAFSVGSFSPGWIVYANIETAKRGGCPVTWIDCGHHPELSCPEVLADYIRDVLAAHE